MNNKFINYLTNLVESKNNENNKTRIKIFSIISILSLAVFIFLLTFSVTMFYTKDIIEVKNQRDQNLIEMMRVNMGEIPRSPSDVRFRMATKIDSIINREGNERISQRFCELFNNTSGTITQKQFDSVKKVNNSIFETKITSFIQPYLNKNEVRVNELSEKFINSPEADFNKVLDEEKQVLNKELEIINDSIRKLTLRNNDLKRVFDFIIILNDSAPLKDNSNEVNFKQFAFLSDEEKNLLNKTYIIENFSASISTIDSLMSLPNKSDATPNESAFLSKKNDFEQLKSMKKKYDKNSITLELNKNTASIVKFLDEKSIKERNQVSLETYRKNKAYIFQNQFDICKLSIQYCIEEGMRYFALYRGLIVVILVFSGLMSICVFAISAKGWNGSDPILKVITMTVAIILGMANLMNLVLKPKDNYVSYIVKAERNEAVQTEIIKFFNNYNNLKEDDIDKLIRKNFDNIIKFSEILPETNEEGLKQGITDLSNLKKEADPK